MTETNVTLRRRTVHALMVAAFTGATVGAALLSGLLMRAGVQSGYAHSAGVLFAALMMYPVLRALTELRRLTPVPFKRWALVWTATAIVSAAIVYPLVTRLLDRLL